MNIGICQQCEAEFEVIKGFETMCLSCWIEKKRAEKKPSYKALEETLKSSFTHIETLLRWNKELRAMLPPDADPPPW